MSGDVELDLSPEDAHPKAAEALADRFYWDTGDPTGPFGNETGAEAFAAFREWRDDHPQASPIALLDALCARWEVENAHWDAASAAEVEAIGADDEFSLLTRDEALFGLAFGQIIDEGTLDPEIRRRALLAVRRQELPAFLHAWGDRATERADRLERMRAALARKWG
jgi:uncharacterized protein YfeS